MEPFDVALKKAFAEDRVALLQRMAARGPSARTRFGFWLVDVGLRIAHARPVFNSI